MTPSEQLTSWHHGQESHNISPSVSRSLMISLNMKNYPFPPIDMITYHKVNTQFDTNTLKMSILCHPEQSYHCKPRFWNIKSWKSYNFVCSLDFFFLLERAILNAHKLVWEYQLATFNWPDCEPQRCNTLQKIKHRHDCYFALLLWLQNGKAICWNWKIQPLNYLSGPHS